MVVLNDHKRRFLFLCVVSLFSLILTTPVSADIIIDDGDPGTSHTGAWYTSGGTTSYNGSSLWSRNGATYKWTMNGQAAGTYEVSMWWSGYATRASNIAVRISHSGGTSTVYINQRQNAGRWNVLGNYNFGTTGSVTIVAANGSTVSTCADAVRFAPVSTSNDTIIDNRSSKTSRTGTWAVSSATGSYLTDSFWSRDGSLFRWHFTPSQSGDYDLSMWWTAWTSRSTRIPVDIQNAAGTDRIYIDQQQNGGKWNDLGRYPFNAGTEYRIILTSQPGPTSTSADAVKLTYADGSNIPPSARIVSISPRPAFPEEMVNFSGSGSDSDGTITAYNWRSSIQGNLSTERTFSTSSLIEGTHVIYFKVKDDVGSWSTEANMLLSVRGCGPSIKIMSLGNSITHGTYGTVEYRPQSLITGYRKPLNESLLAAGYYIDFIGSIQTGWAAAPVFDYEHEGHGGWTDAQIASHVYGWLSQRPADIVLLHVGTNALDPSPTDVEDILDEIDRHSKDTVVLLAKIVNTKTPNSTISLFNRNIQAMAEGRIASGDKILIVDQENALIYPDDMADTYHPNASGYRKMALTWHDSLTELLPVCETASALIISARAGTGGTVSPSGALPVHYGSQKTYTITPSSGYHISNVLIDGQSAGARTSYTFSDITQGHTLEALFTAN